MSTLPPPGFYTDPHDPSGATQRWWDGATWTAHTQPAAAPAAAPSTPDIVGQLSELPGRVTEWVKENPEQIQQVGGAVLAADGVVGFGKRRAGVFDALSGIFGSFVVLVILTGVLLVIWSNIKPPELREPVAVVATVVDVYRGLGSDSGCAVTVEYPVGTQVIQASPPYRSSALCSLRDGERVEIEYDASEPDVFRGLEEGIPLSIALFILAFAAVFVWTFFSSVFTFFLRATQIGGGIALIARARKKRAEKDAAKAARKAGITR